jgi:hypothetical protein
MYSGRSRGGRSLSASSSLTGDTQAFASMRHCRAGVSMCRSYLSRSGYIVTFAPSPVAWSRSSHSSTPGKVTNRHTGLETAM